MKRVLVIGATSAIAGETARAYAAEGASLALVARRAERLAQVADDLRVRGAGSVTTLVLDAADRRQHRVVIEAAARALGGLDAALIAHGVLPEQARCEWNEELVLEGFDVNAASVIGLLVPLAELFERQRSGVVCVISSVAGDRGRASNYAYGAAKAAVDAFTSGLRGRLGPAGVAVVTVKPGFVRTPMTAHLPPSPLFASPRRVGLAVKKAMDSRAAVVYVPWWWRPIMAILRHLPERIFHKLRI